MPQEITVIKQGAVDYIDSLRTCTLHTYSHHSQLCLQSPVQSCVPVGKLYKNTHDDTSCLAFKAHISCAVARPAAINSWHGKNINYCTLTKNVVQALPLLVRFVLLNCSVNQTICSAAGNFQIYRLSNCQINESIKPHAYQFEWECNRFSEGPCVLHTDLCAGTHFSNCLRHFKAFISCHFLLSRQSLQQSLK